MTEVVVSPVCALLTARCTPELERVQAKFGARTSFHEAAWVLAALLPIAAANHENVRRRTHAVAVRLEAADRHTAAEVVAAQGKTDQAAVADASRPVVAGRRPRACRARAPDPELRGDLRQGGASRPTTGRSTARRPTWNACASSSGTGATRNASEALGRIVSWAEYATVANGAVMEAKARRLAALGTALLTYIGNNEGALIDDDEGYAADRPISTSRAEGTVNHLVSARMRKRQQMRRTPVGAHRVLQVRAAVLDGRCGFGQQSVLLAA